MSKIQALRTAVLASAGIEADQLFTRVTDGTCISTGTGVRYEGEALVMLLEWTGDAHQITRTLLQWLHQHEPTAAQDALKFEVDVISHQMVDLKFTLPFSETVKFDVENCVDCTDCTDGVPLPT